MQKVLVSGCNGGMGQLVCSAIKSSKDMEVIGGFDKKSDNSDCPVFDDIDTIGRNPKPDVIIDFSSAEATRKISAYAYEKHVPLVVATTNLTDKDIAILKEYSLEIPVFQAANMSFDVALLKNVLQLVASRLTDVDIEIHEVHHNRKADSPSGTAWMLGNAINETLGGTRTLVYARDGKREKNEIGLSSSRGGNIAGEHTVSFYGQAETLEIKHFTYSREVFAEGALKAARFILTKEKGFYTMDDLIESM